MKKGVGNDCCCSGCCCTRRVGETLHNTWSRGCSHHLVSQLVICLGAWLSHMAVGSFQVNLSSPTLRRTNVD
ncbi:uncharacterized protein BO72DRAFT_122818 [Aspergillus fijiensis CBS 313.89]|uniref:Uncharacterized protein n=1 Tax=Aspergillus fijiensis CBS 313.89 TaxID=1448319 RepID=A0A8G1RP37_9EURO|nr:uncharacterized protein BO72DRAFT_122818 [Aspergillus fijiensis CBS 313.89]RAK76880.1 hypothetical protein BO72DRAFT_122818 [Aspergillus fijiensis CBS 313.89]